MREGDKVVFIEDRLYRDLKISRNYPLIVVESIGDYYWVVGIKSSPKYLKGRVWNMLIFFGNLKIIR